MEKRLYTIIIYTENMRATYASKMRSQPRFAKQYKSKADNFEIARNCCIGAAAAMYVYNLIDAEAEINHKELSAEQIISDAT